MKPNQRAREKRASVHQKRTEPRSFGAGIAAFVKSRVGLAATGILILGAAVRLVFIGVPIRYDEAFTFLEFARYPVARFIGDYSFPNNHILNTLLVHGSIQFLGPEEWAIRLPALLAGIACLPVTYVLGRMLGGEMAGLWAMSLEAGSAPLIEYSTNGRGYSIVLLCTAVMMLAGARILRGADEWKDWAVFCVAGIAGMFAIPVMLYPVASTFLWILAGGDGKRHKPVGQLVPRLAAAGAVIAAGTLLCYLPVIRGPGWSALASNRFVAPQSWSEVTGSASALPASLLAYFHQYLPIPLEALVVAAFLVGVVRLPRLTAATLLATAGIVAAQRVVPAVRVFTFALSIYLLIAAVGASWILERIRQGSMKRLVLSGGLPVAWTAVAAMLVVLARGPERSIDRFPEARQIADLLTRRYGSSVAFLASTEANETIAYYGSDRGARNFGLPLKPDEPPPTIRFVVNRRVEDLDSFQRKKMSYLIPFNRPHLVEVVDSADVYEAESVLTQGVQPGAILDRYLEQVETAGAIDSTEVDGAQIATSTLYRVGRLDDALRLGLLLRRQYPRNAYVLSLLGATYLALNDLASAESAFLAERGLEPGDPSVLNNLGVVMQARGRPREAESYFQAARAADSTLRTPR